MKSKLVRFFAAAALALPMTLWAQTPDAPSSAAAPSAISVPGGSKVGTINIEQAIFASNEGQRDFDALGKKLEPKQTELKGLNDELDGLKKQLQTQGDKLNDQTRGTLVKQIDQKQKSFDRSVQDAREDAQNQQNEIAQRILQKMLPIVVKYAGENQYGLILDTSNSWPQGPVLWAGTSVDITKAIVDSYNLQSGVAAPANPKPAATRPATTAPATKPATAPATTKPAPK